MSTTTTSLTSTTTVSPGAIKNLVAAIQAQARGLDSASVFTLTGQALTSLQNTLNNYSRVLQQILYEISTIDINPSLIGGYVVLSIVSNSVSIDLSLGLNFELLLNQAAQVTVQNPTNGSGSLSYGMTFSLYIVQDATGNRPIPAFGTAFASEVQGIILVQAANTGSPLGLIFRPDGLWHLASVQTGLPLT
jgi:hypothetical protein